MAKFIGKCRNCGKEVHYPYYGEQPIPKMLREAAPFFERINWAPHGILIHRLESGCRL